GGGSTMGLPAERVKETLRLRLEVFPTALAELGRGLEALERQPQAAFEPALAAPSSGVLVLGQKRQAAQLRPELERLARQQLGFAPARLSSSECCDPATEKRRGLEWVGGNGTPHAGLTAYGYLQMNDLARYEAVDRALVERTRRYLRGAPAKEGAPLGTVPDAASLAYALWALTESGKDDVGRQLRSLGNQA